MKTLHHIKEKVYNQLLNLLDEKIVLLLHEIDSIKKSRNSDTKSSAGDKFETGREMMNTELNKNEAQLNKTNILKKSLLQINIKKTYEKVEFGSIIRTDKEDFFMSIGIGKVETDSEIYYAISINSPIGKAMQGKVVGDKIQFQDRIFTIEEIS